MRRRPWRSAWIVRSLVLASAFGATARPAIAQDAAEQRVLTIDDYALWRSVRSAALSDDGAWVAFVYAKRETDDTLVVRRLSDGNEHRIPRASDPQLSDDGRWVAYQLSPAVAEIERLEEAGDPVLRKAELLNLETGEKKTWDDITSFTFAKGSRAFVAKKRKADRNAKHDGTELIVRYLDRNYEELLGSVDEYGFNKPGTHLAYTVDARDRDGNGLYLLDVTTGARRALDNTEASFSRLTWESEEGIALAVLRGDEKKGFTQHENVLLAFPDPADPEGTRFEFDPSKAEHFPGNHVISEKASLEWSPDRSRVFVGIRQQEEEASKRWEACKPATDTDEQSAQKQREQGQGQEQGQGEQGQGQEHEGPKSGKPKDSGPVTVTGAGGVRIIQVVPVEDRECSADEPADVDIWHHADDRLQSVQIVRASRDRDRTYRAVVHLDGTFVRLADERMESVDITRDGKWAIGQDDKDYISDWEPGYSDIYRIDTRTGERTPVLEKQLRTLGLSPDSRHFLYWKDGHVWDYRIAEDEHVNLTENAPVSFVDETFDRFGEKPPHGVTGWTKDGRGVILETRYDLWLRPLDGSKPANLTKGVGASSEIEFRHIRLDPEERFIDLKKPMLLSAYGQWTKKAGFYRLEDGDLTQLVFDDARFGRPSKAKNAEKYLFTRERFDVFPDYHVSGPSFTDAVKVTDANPQQAEFAWGRRILFDFTNRDGVRLQGTLAIPDSYEPGQRLPMLVNFYEKNSQNLHSYAEPRYASSPNFSGYVSNGYLVMQPDIHFRLRTSHNDMLECVEAAVRKVIEMGYADPERIALHGHSYSGQGAAYIATRSKMFAAVVAGAAATNLISDFNQLWKTNGTNQHGYDTYGQGRFATNPYDDLELYMNESAVFHARELTTPLLQLHGTDDGSVEWLQAVEFYNALRFNDKPVILLSYPGEAHGLRKFENQKDFQIRARQFIDHYLRGAPAPDWMADGRSLLEKQRLLDSMKKSGDGG